MNTSEDQAPKTPQPPHATGPSAPALDGIRVLDLTQFEAGTSCTQMLAWLGAEVIKVEEPLKGEQGRGATADASNADSFYFMILNANKRSVTANLKSAEGKEIVDKLIRECDVFVENFAPGVIERLGLGYERVRALNPRIVYAQIKGYSPTGPYANYLSFDMTAQAMGGSLSVTGEEGGKPVKAGCTIGDSGAGMHCAMGILAALYQREHTGRGQRVEVAMQETVINFSRISFARQLIDGAAAPRVGNQSVLGATSPSEAYPCKGGGPNDYCFIYTSRAGSVHWDRLVRLMGLDDMVGDPRFASPESRYMHREIIDAAIRQWTRQHDKHTVMRMLGDAGVPAGAVLDTLELSQDPHLRERGVFVTVDHPVRGTFTMPGWPVHMTDSRVEVTAAPLLGADTRDIYTRVLGVSDATVDEMRARGAI